MRFGVFLFLLTVLVLNDGPIQAVPSDCYENDGYYLIPASNHVEAKKKALLCFFAEISIKSDIHGNNTSVKFEDQTSISAKSAAIDWSGMKKEKGTNIYKWSIETVQKEQKKVSDLNSKKYIPVEKEMIETWRPKFIERVIVEIKSEPTGADVIVDSIKSTCHTPCKLELTTGTHDLELNLKNHAKLQKKISVSSDVSEFTFQLKETIGRIDVSECPAGTKILLDNNAYGTTPLDPIEVKQGNYILSAIHPEYFRFNEKFFVKNGTVVRSRCPLIQKEGAIDISATDAKGIPLHASIYVDGVEQDVKTPSAIRARIGERRVTLIYDGSMWESLISVEHQKTTKKIIILDADYENAQAKIAQKRLIEANVPLFSQICPELAKATSYASIFSNVGAYIDHEINTPSDVDCKIFSSRIIKIASSFKHVCIGTDYQRVFHDDTGICYDTSNRSDILRFELKGGYYHNVEERNDRALKQYLDTILKFSSLFPNIQSIEGRGSFSACPDLAPFSGHKVLNSIKLSFYSDTSPPAKCKIYLPDGLEELYIVLPDLVNPMELRKLVKLYKLTYNSGEDLSFLPNLLNLSSLSVAAKNSISFTHVSQLKNLKYLRLSAYDLNDANALAPLSRMTYVDKFEIVLSRDFIIKNKCEIVKHNLLKAACGERCQWQGLEWCKNLNE